MTNGKISIGPKFFQSEIRVYRDPILGFIRENLQNAVDSGASRIEITITDQGEEKAQFTITDNGCGMDKEQLETVYFVLGETTKCDSNTVGGFGKARILTCFSQNEYQLWTDNLHVVGVGSDYTTEEVAERRRGVKLQINTNWSASDLISETKSYLSKCQLAHVTITINGERWSTWSYRRRQVRELTFGTVHTNKAASPELLVRVNGTLMYTCWTNAPAQVIVEIHSDKSRNVLQASRDGLQGVYQNELSSFINELNINRRSALRRKTCKSTTYQGTGTFTARRGILSVNKISEMIDSAIKGIASIMPRMTLARANDDSHIGVERQAVNAHNAMPTDRYEETVGNSLNIFDIIIEDETENEAIRKRIDQYDPRNWDVDGSTHWNGVGTYRKGTGMYRQIVMWRTACEAIIELLQANFANAPDSIQWGVGWLFSDVSSARWIRKGSINYLMLNPCEDNGTMKYSISAKDDLIKLVVLAAHEVTHIIQSDHDEDFAGSFTELMQHVSINMSDIVRRMKEAKDAIRESLVTV